MQSCNNADILVVEPNVVEHKVFKLTNYKDAYAKSRHYRFFSGFIQYLKHCYMMIIK